MFTSFLQKHSLEDMIRNGTRKLYPAAEDRLAWDGIPEEYREEIREMAEEAGMTYLGAREALTGAEPTSETERIYIVLKEKGKEDTGGDAVERTSYRRCAGGGKHHPGKGLQAD